MKTASRMRTALRLTPADSGVPLSVDELDGAEQGEGYKYEIIHGRLYVSPQPALPTNDVEDWLLGLLKEYARTRPAIINFVTNKARVFTPASEDVSAPEPDIAAYKDYPSLARRRRRPIAWDAVSPLLVVEIISEDDPGKDLMRNPPLYLAVPSIKEYWVVDTRPDPYEPSLIVHQRHRGAWRVVNVPFGGTYTTKLLPGFTLHLDLAAGEE